MHGGEEIKKGEKAFLLGNQQLQEKIDEPKQKRNNKNQQNYCYEDGDGNPFSLSLSPLLYLQHLLSLSLPFYASLFGLWAVVFVGSNSLCVRVFLSFSVGTSTWLTEREDDDGGGRLTLLTPAACWAVFSFPGVAL